MKILFTGASSFTGYWFVKELSASGHDVTAVFTGSPDSYTGLRKLRINELLNVCRPVWSTPFGSDAFIHVIGRELNWDVLCHHAAYVTDYKSDNFNIMHAVNENTYNISTILTKLATRGLTKVVLTGSIFEQGEGIGEQPLRAFSPYGLSKGLTASVFQYWHYHLNIPLFKFVIPNPFGPFEEPRFTSYLMNTWAKRETAIVKTKDYIRDNIHVSLLAKIYSYYTELSPAGISFGKINPSGYPESQGAFTIRFANAIRERIKLPCHLAFEEQKNFTEPRIRINTDIIDSKTLGWCEQSAWDSIADYYIRELNIN